MGTTIAGVDSSFSESHDELNQAFLELEEALQGMREKAEAHIRLSGWAEPSGLTGAHVLAFTKSGREWGLYYASLCDQDYDPEEEDIQHTHITNAPVFAKRLAVEKMKELLAAIDSARVEQISENLQMAAQLREVTAAVLAKEPRRGE